jgi:hypothetical protein
VPQAGSQMVSPGLGAMQSTMAWISGRGVKYWPAPLLVSCAFFLQQAFVGVAFDVRAHGRPVLAVDQVHHQAAQLGRVLELVLRLAEDQADGALLGAEALQRVAVVVEQLVTVFGQQRRPVKPFGNRAGLAPRLAALVGHLEEQQVGKLFDIVAVAHDLKRSTLQ